MAARADRGIDAAGLMRGPPSSSVPAGLLSTHRLRRRRWLASRCLFRFRCNRRPASSFPREQCGNDRRGQLGSLWPSAAPRGPLTLPLLHATYALRIPNPHPANRSQLLKIPIVGQMKIEWQSVTHRLQAFPCIIGARLRLENPMSTSKKQVTFKFRCPAELEGKLPRPVPATRRYSRLAQGDADDGFQYDQPERRGNGQAVPAIRRRNDLRLSDPAGSAT